MQSVIKGTNVATEARSIYRILHPSPTVGLIVTETILFEKLQLYLNDEEFLRIFSMAYEEFEGLPKWKKLDLKKKVGLF